MAKDKKKKPQRPKAQNPRGFGDYFGADVVERNEMLSRITAVYHAYGFDPLETPAVETVESLGKFLPDVDRPNEGVFAWQDDDDWVALRYDLTAPLARVYAQHRNDLPTPYRRYAVGPVWRNEKPGPGRFRQFYQCDADTVGTPTIAADAELCCMLSDALEAAGIARGDYAVRTNNRKVLNGALENVGLSEDQQELRADVLRTIDKFDKVGEAGVRDLLGKGRKDQSGAFIDGINLADGQIDVIVAFLLARADTNASTVNNLRNVVGTSETGLAGVRELEMLAELADAQGYAADRLIIDPSVVRGLGYYTGPVVEAELTFEILDKKGRPRQFGSVAGGGRYDDLVKRFTGQAVPATGISIGVDRLLAAIREKSSTNNAITGPILVTVMDKEQIVEYQTIVTELRNAGVRAELYLGNPKNFGNQLKYADTRNSPVAVIQGSDERDRGVVQIKDLALGKQLAANIETNEQWKAQPAQMEISRADIVTEVRKMLARADG